MHGDEDEDEAGCLMRRVPGMRPHLSHASSCALSLCSVLVVARARARACEQSAVRQMGEDKDKDKEDLDLDL